MSSRLRKKVRHSYLEYTEKDIYLPPLKKAESNHGVKGTNRIPEQTTTYKFSLNCELASKIKSSLKGGRKESPIVNIRIPFDMDIFSTGLQFYGKKKRSVRGVERFTISKYQDLDRVLGENWHFRGINVNGDFCYAILDTIEFYIYKRRALKEYIPLTTSSISGTEVVVKEQLRKQGYMLVFSFVKNYGSSERFGFDKQIF